LKLLDRHMQRVKVYISEYLSTAKKKMGLKNISIGNIFLG